MDPATKAEAQAKLTNLYVGIGYPETGRDYSDYLVKADDIFGNLWRGSLFDYHRFIARLGHPVDRKEWAAGFIRRPSMRRNCPCKMRLAFPQHFSNRRTSTRRRLPPR